MNICVINGSPKSDTSITLQTTRFLQVVFPEINFQIIHAGNHIRMLEKDFSPALEAIRNSDIILFSYPVYTFIVPSQLHRFIELMKESGQDFSDKAFCQISTSKHFYDVTAHTFIADNCADMNIKNLGSLSADMDDLLTKQGQKDAVNFMKLVLFRFENKITEPFMALQHTSVPGKIPAYKKSFTETEKSQDKTICIVCDLRPEDKNLKNMIEDFISLSPYQVKVVNIFEYKFQGGCTGCFHCAVNGTCFWKDGFDKFLRNEIQTCDSIVYAFTIKDHSMGSLFKTYDDHQFCNGHRTVTSGLPFGYIVNGDLKAEPNLRVIIEARSEVGGNFLAGVATNAEEISVLSKTLVYAMKNKLLFPKTFWGEGGMRIFRDLIYVMRGFMKEDHRFYKARGIYKTLPNKQKKRIIMMQFVGLLMRASKKSKSGTKMMNQGMLMPYEKLLEKTRNQMASQK